MKLFYIMKVIHIIEMYITYKSIKGLHINDQHISNDKHAVICRANGLIVYCIG